MPSKECSAQRGSNARAVAQAIRQNEAGSGEESSGPSDSEQEQQSPSRLEPSHKKRRQRSGFPRKDTSSRTKKHKKRPHLDDDSDTEASRKPLGTVYCDNQKQQRLDNHPMAKIKRRNLQKDKAGPKKRKNKLPEAAAKRADSDDDDTETEATGEEMTALAAQKVLSKLRKEYQTYTDRPRGPGEYERSNMEKVVYKLSKWELFKKQKIVDKEGLKKATQRVREAIKPTDLQGLPPDVEVEAIQIWDDHYKDLVRIGLNEKRNHIQQEVRKAILALVQDPEYKDSITVDPDEIKELIFRRGFEKLKGDDLEAWQAKLDVLVDVILPKVANSKAWGENYRHTAPMYCARQEKPGVEDPEKCVTITDLAYTWVIYKNYQHQWDWEIRRIQKRLTPFPNNHEIEVARGKQSITDPDDPNGKKVLYYEPKPDTKWTKSEGGRCEYGGWPKQGYDAYLTVAKELHQDMKKPAGHKRIKKADEAMLERLRVKHGREAREQKRSSRKKKSGDGAQQSDLEDETDLFDE